MIIRIPAGKMKGKLLETNKKEKVKKLGKNPNKEV